VVKLEMLYKISWLAKASISFRIGQQVAGEPCDAGLDTVRPRHSSALAQSLLSLTLFSTRLTK